jgi:hypothetical protein
MPRPRALVHQEQALKESAAQREAELERQRLLERGRRLESEARAGRRFQRLSIALALLCVVAFVLAFLAVQNWNKAVQHRSEAWSELWAASAERLTDTQPDVAILLALQSLSSDPHPPTSPPAELATALGRMSHASRQLTGHADHVLSVAFAPATNRGASRAANCWPPPASIKRCGCGTPPPDNPTASPFKATPAP